ncbi:hypothetical protein LY76DRAFT_106448 [Colletotrichum caudatum]|nr:hypothetical protein LY76DRAFT_106448 [Colletotrichum caudatum]
MPTDGVLSFFHFFFIISAYFFPLADEGYLGRISIFKRRCATVSTISFFPLLFCFSDPIIAQPRYPYAGTSASVSFRSPSVTGFPGLPPPPICTLHVSALNEFPQLHQRPATGSREKKQCSLVMTQQSPASRVRFFPTALEYHCASIRTCAILRETPWIRISASSGIYQQGVMAKKTIPHPG